MKRKIVSGIMLTLLLICMLTLAFNIQPVEAIGTISIKADGSIDPPTAPIQRSGDLYTFTDNITIDDELTGIVVNRDNIVIDGAGHAIQASGGIGWPLNFGIWLAGRSNVTIKNVKITGFLGGIHLVDSQRNHISANNITANVGYGIYLENSSNNTLDRNIITDIDNWAVRIEGSYNTISENNVTDNLMSIDLSGSYNNILRNKVLFGKKNYSYTDPYSGLVIVFASVGVYLGGSNNVISGNTIVNYTHGMYGSCSFNTISGNNITRNYDERPELSDYSGGIFLLGGSLNNSITGNNIEKNQPYGILTQYTFNNTISENNIVDNNYGIASEWANNSIYHNNFIRNTIQITNVPDFYVSESGEIHYFSIWDDGYPSGGNYWSDYTGVDLFNGPFQNETGSDGIGDTPYMRDRYPLMNPWTPIETIVKMNGKDYPITIVSNTTIEQIVATKNFLSFESSGPTGEKGYILVIFPMVNTTEIEVFIDGEKLTPPPFPVITSNTTHYFIYFEFTLSTHEITIQYAISPDVNGDGIVDMGDISLACYAAFAFPGHPRWDPRCDIDQNGVIDMMDISTMCYNFLKHL